MTDDNRPVMLGPSQRNAWHVSNNQADLVRASRPAMPALLKAEPKDCTIDLARTAMIVVDMQNDFCHRDGWLASIGVDVAPARAPIAPLMHLLPALRAVDMPIVWVNWGNRPDRMNLSPALLHVYNPTGAGIGLGDRVPKTGAPVLEKDSWSAAIVDELAPAKSDIRVDKHRMSGFWDTPLDSILRTLEVKTVFFSGVNTDQCVLHSLTDAHFLGYNCVLVEDCCGTTSPDFCAEATLWNIKKCFGFVTNSAEVISAMPKKATT
jgi:nicotinamidase-related amidase